MATSPLPAPSTDPATILAEEQALILPHFTANDAWEIGSNLRQTIIELFPRKAAVINITLTNSDNLLFHACTASGVLPDNDVWVRRKRTTVKRWGVSSWYMGRKFGGHEADFANKYVLGSTAGEFAIHGGGLPVRVKGVEGVVGIIVVSGLKQEEDHMVVLQELRRFIDKHQ